MVATPTSREHEDADAIVKKHIKLLHRYNEAKDATQVNGRAFFVRIIICSDLPL
jgi:hypothetical protein